MNKTFRQDYRTNEQFAQDIKQHTTKESFLVQLFKVECEHMGYECTIVDNGSDNTGDVIDKATCAADYLITTTTALGNTYTGLYEIKNSPVSTKWTFKVNSLKQYIKQGANILLFWGTGRLEKNPGNIDRKHTRWGVIHNENIQKMIDAYEPYEEYTFGNKLCIRIPSADFHKWLNIRKLTNET